MWKLAQKDSQVVSVPEVIIWQDRKHLTYMVDLILDESAVLLLHLVLHLAEIL